MARFPRLGPKGLVWLFLGAALWLIASIGAAQPAPSAKAPVKGTAVVIEEAQSFENLTIFPITSQKQESVGPLMTLADALAKGTAEVREVGAQGGDDRAENPAQRRSPSQRARGGGAQVGTLVLENKGATPVYVLAGTIVKGGNQDRQIGQDFIVGARQTVPVDAFCVEHGRWSARREGVATGGRFGTMPQLSTSDVRAAGQYKRNQGEVWSKVGSVNDANRKSAASGTLLATLDDKEVQAKRAALAGRVEAFLKATTPQRELVGMAYAIDGKVRGVRWFAHHDVFELQRVTLVNTAAIDAITAQGAKPAATPPRVTPDAVARFVAEVEETREKQERDTAGANVNVYSESGRGFGSTTRLKASPAAKPVNVSSDFVAK